MLPYVIEYLLTLKKSNAHVVHQGISQTIVPAVPPNTQIVLEVFPFADDYADLVYASYIDNAVMPGVFFAWGQYYGSRTYEGILTGGLINYSLDSFVYISSSEPAIALIENQTALNQYYAGRVFFLAIANEEDYQFIQEALARMGTSARLEQLAIESTQLLRQIATGVPAPQPPVGG